MIVNMDRSIKNNLLQMYKKEAEEHVIKKQEDRLRKINEEREYLHQVDQRENAREDRIRLEKIRKINEQMGNYQKMLQHQPTKFKSKISDVKINNYGFNVAGGNSAYQVYPRQYSSEPSQLQSNPITNPNSNLNPNPNSNSFYTASNRDYPQRQIDLVRREDHMKNFLTDKQNEKEVKSYFVNQKNEQMKYYKELLDSQCSQKNTPHNNTANIQNANIINHQRRFNLANDPYNIRKNNDFGLCKLERNPILNPVNNLDYNKYLNFSKEMPPQDQGQLQAPNYVVNRTIDQYQPRQEQNAPNQMNDYNNNQYQPEQEQYAPNQMNDYNNNQYQPGPNRMNDFNQYQPQMQREYHDNQSLPYKYNDSIPNQPSMRNNIYQPEHIPTPTGQRLIQAGASSMLR